MRLPLRQEIHLVPPPPPETEVVYKRDEQRRSTHDWCLCSFQWLVTAVHGVVWGYAILGLDLNFQSESPISHRLTERRERGGFTRILRTLLLDQFCMADLAATNDGLTT